MPSLKRSSDFQLLKDQGKFQHINQWLAISSRNNNKQSLRWGWTIPKKVGNAVTRNRLRRWGREFLKEFEKNDVDINFIFKNRGKEFYEKLSHQEFDKTFARALKKVLPK